MPDLDDTFTTIAERAIHEAERVPCTLPEFYVGLRVMRAVLDARLEAEAAEVDTRWEHVEPER